MSDYTPTTETVRERFADGFPRFGYSQALADFDRWLAAHDAEVRAESEEAHERTKRGAKTLGEIVVRQVEDMLRWAGMEDQIGTDDPDQQLAWERCAEMPGRIAELEAELAELRAAAAAEEQPEWEYRVQHPVYTDGLKDWAGWTKYRHLAEEGARRWGEESWIERRRTGPIERVSVKQEGADDVRA